MKKLPFEMAKLDLGQYGINLVSCHGSLGEQAMLQSLNGSQIPQPPCVSLSFSEVLN